VKGDQFGRLSQTADSKRVTASGTVRGNMVVAERVARLYRPDIQSGSIE